MISWLLIHSSVLRARASKQKLREMQYQPKLLYADNLFEFIEGELRDEAQNNLREIQGCTLVGKAI
jgi:ABC-type Fe3+/spermidine/putrescine transport system ATPase subunit